MSSQHVLVTGAAGAVGQVVVHHLQAQGHHVRSFDRVPMANQPDHIVANLQDVPALQRAIQGVDAIIHLAATPDAADFTTDLVPNNIIAPWHLLEAARDAKVARVVIASTIRVGRLHDWSTHTVRVADGYAPHDGYSLSKVTCEVMGEMFARLYGMTVLMARIGWVVRNPTEVQTVINKMWDGEIALSQDDAARFFAACIENPLHFPTAIRFAALYATSRAVKHSTVDLSDARDIIGWEPQNIWPEGSPWVAFHEQLTKSS
jgi:uronate dehydrogenase